MISFQGNGAKCLAKNARFVDSITHSQADKYSLLHERLSFTLLAIHAF